MPYLSPQTLTRDEVHALLTASRGHPRDHLIFSLALGTGLRLSELVGLDVGDLYFPTGDPRIRVRVRPEIAKRGRTPKVIEPLTRRARTACPPPIRRGRRAHPDRA